MSPTKKNNRTDGAAWGRLTNQDDEDRQRRRAAQDPGAYHGAIAAAELHWFDAGRGGWLSRDADSGCWHGFDAATGEPLEKPGIDTDWRPWRRAFDDSDAPFYRWFSGATTNACFNEVDRHVLNGRGRHAAFVFEGDRWDPSKNDGRGGPVFETEIDYRRLLVETVLRAEVLTDLGLQKGDRIALDRKSVV